MKFDTHNKIDLFAITHESFFLIFWNPVVVIEIVRV